MTRRLSMRGGFTMVEVMIAAAILACFSAGTLWTTWKISSYAHEQAEIMAADALCADYLNVLSGVPYHRLESKPGLTIRNQALPVVTWKDWRGQTQKRRLLRQQSDFTSPTCDITVKTQTKNGAEQKLMTVKIKWQSGKGAGLKKSWSRSLAHPGANRKVSGN